MGVDDQRRVIFVNRYFYPDHSATSVLLSELSFALAQRGLRVTVITSRLHYETTATAALSPQENVNGVEVWRVWTSQRGRQQLTGRSLDYLSFYLAAGWRLWRLAGAGDIIVAKTDPPLLSVMAALIAWLRKARLVNWLQDIFPEVAEVLNIGGGLGRVAFRLMRPFRNWSLVAASTNVVVGEGMAVRLRGQGIASEKIRVIPNWSDGALIVPIAAAQNKLRKDWVPSNAFIVGYAGNLGRAHEIATIIEAISLLQSRAGGPTADDVARQVVFVFVGDGAQRARLQREVQLRGLANVRLHPYQPRERLAETLGIADLHLVSLNPKLEGLIVPSKIYGIAAAGRPTLFIGAPEGEIALLVEQAGFGFTVAPGDGNALINRILQLAKDPELCASMGLRARRAFEQRWSKGTAVEQWEEVLNFEFTSGSGVTRGGWPKPVRGRTVDSR